MKNVIEAADLPAFIFRSFDVTGESAIGNEGGDTFVPAFSAIKEEADQPVEVPVGVPTEEVQRLVEQARAEGVQEGRQAAESELRQVINAFCVGVSALDALRPQLLHDAEDDLLKLSVAIARKVVQKEIACDAGILACTIKKVLDLVSDEGEIAIRLHPDDYARAAELPEFKVVLGGNRRIKIRDDSGISSGGCVVETSQGNIDATTEAQFDAILNALGEERNRRREDGEG